jgi:hypothetical protein
VIFKIVAVRIGIPSRVLAVKLLTQNYIQTIAPLIPEGQGWPFDLHTKILITQYLPIIHYLPGITTTVKFGQCVCGIWGFKTVLNLEGLHGRAGLWPSLRCFILSLLTFPRVSNASIQNFNTHGANRFAIIQSATGPEFDFFARTLSTTFKAVRQQPCPSRNDVLDTVACGQSGFVRTVFKPVRATVCVLRYRHYLSLEPLQTRCPPLLTSTLRAATN